MQRSRRVPDLSWCQPGGSRGYVATRPLRWDIGKRGSGWVLTVPEGAEFESSVPRLLRWLWSPDDPYFIKAAAVHDALIEQSYRRAFADVQWYEAALSDHAPRLKTVVGYLSMRGLRFVRWAATINRRRA